jgi:hypothetical protein
MAMIDMQCSLSRCVVLRFNLCLAYEALALLPGKQSGKDTLLESSL